MADWDVVVIGGGPAGLAGAMMLAKAGARVTLIERQPHVGGRTSTLGAGGYQFDLGPTFFLYPRVLESIFRSVGRDLHEEVELIKLDPQYHLVFGQVEYTGGNKSQSGSKGEGELLQ